VTDVSVIVVSYNTRALTLACLAALEASRTDRTSFDIVVLDNASQDGSPGAIATTFPDVTLIRLDENVGWGRGVNRAVAASDAEYLLLLNPDTEPVGNVIDDLLQFARAHFGHGLYTGRTLRLDGSDDGHSCWGLPSLWSYLCFATGLSTVLRGQAWANPEGLVGYDRRGVREVPAVSGCMMLVQRDLFLNLHGFDPRYFMYSEDIDLSARALRAGVRPLVTPDAMVKHIGGASSSSGGQRVSTLRGKTTYVRLHWSPGRARLGVALLAGGVGLRAVCGLIGRLLRGRGGRDARTSWEHAWRERRVWLAGWPAVDEPRPGQPRSFEERCATAA
jgi:N-acetylglucosaminyl-diphospho-decaprenol L-rhamnosyltransferase